eukprot:jgi/Mesvir1/18648/Mv17150-RA.1
MASQLRFLAEFLCNVQTLRIYIYRITSDDCGDGHHVSSAVGLDVASTEIGEDGVLSITVSVDHGELTVLSVPCKPLAQSLRDSLATPMVTPRRDYLEVKYLVRDASLAAGLRSALAVDDVHTTVDRDVAVLQQAASSHGVHFFCRACGYRLLQQPISAVKALPSPHWLELAEHWYCGSCCGGDRSLALVELLQARLRAKPGVGLLGLSTVTLAAGDLRASLRGTLGCASAAGGEDRASETTRDRMRDTDCGNASASVVGPRVSARVCEFACSCEEPRCCTGDTGALQSSCCHVAAQGSGEGLVRLAASDSVPLATDSQHSNSFGCCDAVQQTRGSGASHSEASTGPLDSAPSSEASGEGRGDHGMGVKVPNGCCEGDCRADPDVAGHDRRNWLVSEVGSGEPVSADGARDDPGKMPRQQVGDAAVMDDVACPGCCTLLGHLSSQDGTLTASLFTYRIAACGAAREVPGRCPSMAASCRGVGAVRDAEEHQMGRSAISDEAGSVAYLVCGRESCGDSLVGQATHPQNGAGCAGGVAAAHRQRAASAVAGGGHCCSDATDRCPQSEATTVDRCQQSEAATVDRCQQSEATTVDRCPQSEATSGDICQQSEAATVDRCQQSEAETVDRCQQSEATTVDRCPQSEATTVDRCPQSEATTVDRCPQSEATTVDRCPQSEAATVDRCQQSEATTGAGAVTELAKGAAREAHAADRSGQGVGDLDPSERCRPCEERAERDAMSGGHGVAIGGLLGASSCHAEHGCFVRDGSRMESSCGTSDVSSSSCRCHSHTGCQDDEATSANGHSADVGSPGGRGAEDGGEPAGDMGHAASGGLLWRHTLESVFATELMEACRARASFRFALRLQGSRALLAQVTVLNTDTFVLSGQQPRTEPTPSDCETAALDGSRPKDSLLAGEIDNMSLASPFSSSISRAIKVSFKDCRGLSQEQLR